LDARELLGERGVGDDASRLDLAVVSYRDFTLTSMISIVRLWHYT
jgi:hypothetical protein